MRGDVNLIPRDFTLSAYDKIIRMPLVYRSFFNSVVYTLSSTLYALFLTTPCAYALTKQFPGRTFLSRMLTLPLYLSLGLIPFYLVIRALGLYNTPWVMIIPGSLSAYNLIVMRAYYLSNDMRELEEAAAIDGQNPLSTFVTIIMPLSKPIIATIAMFYGVARWNDWFSAMIYLRDQSLFTIQYVLREVIMAGQNLDKSMHAGAESGVMLVSQQYATIIVTVLPIMLFYPFIQRYFIHGIMIGAIKG